MPRKETVQRARRDAHEGKSPSTQAGEFVHDEIRRIRAGKHGARSAKQAIAIGLSEARRAGVKLPPPKRGKASAATQRKARQDLKKAQGPARPSPRRSRSRIAALLREPKSSVSKKALSQQARQAARRRGARDRSRAAKKAAKTRKKSAA